MVFEDHQFSCPKKEEGLDHPPQQETGEGESKVGGFLRRENRRCCLSAQCPAGKKGFKTGGGRTPN